MPPLRRIRVALTPATHTLPSTSPRVGDEVPDALEAEIEDAPTPADDLA